MKFLNALLFFFLLFLCQLSTAQSNPDLLVKKGFDYLYQGKSYTRFDLSSILSSNELAHSIYRKSRKDRNRSVFVGLLTIGTGAVFISGIMIVNKRTSSSKDCLECKVLAAGFVPLALFGTIALRKLSHGITNKKIAIEVFNYDAEQAAPKIGNAPIEINLQWSADGLGISYNF